MSRTEREMAVLRELAELREGAVDAVIFADASHSTMHSVGGWGAWIGLASPLRALLFGGALGRPLYSSTEAEMRAIANATNAARAHLKRGAAILLQSDSMNSLHWILKAYPKTHDWPAADGAAITSGRRGLGPMAEVSQGLATFLETATALDLVVFTRHVSGHQGDKSMRHAINRRCDQLARKHRQMLESEIHRGLK